jgi:hypothetical protein
MTYSTQEVARPILYQRLSFASGGTLWTAVTAFMDAIIRGQRVIDWIRELDFSGLEFVQENWGVTSDVVDILSHAVNLETPLLRSNATSALITVPSRICSNNLRTLHLHVRNAAIPGVNFIGSFQQLRHLNLYLFTNRWPTAETVTWSLPMLSVLEWM